MAINLDVRVPKEGKEGREIQIAIPAPVVGRIAGFFNVFELTANKRVSKAFEQACSSGILWKDIWEKLDERIRKKSIIFLTEPRPDDWEVKTLGYWHSNRKEDIVNARKYCKR